MSQQLRVLVVEDIPDDAELMILHLEAEGFAPEWQRVQTEQEYLTALDTLPEVILADWSLPQFSGLRALEIMIERNLDIPFILVSGSIGEEAAVDALHKGACDYVLKDRSKRLGQVVRRALDSKRYQQEKEQAEIGLQRRLAELEVLFDISYSLRYLENLDAILKSLLDRILVVLSTEAGAIWLERQDEEVLYLSYARGWFEHFYDLVLNPGEGLVGNVYLLGQPYKCSEFISDPKINKKALAIIPSGCGGVLIPINTYQDIIGVMVISVPLPREIDDHEIKLLSSAAEMAGIAVHRIRLFNDLRATSSALVSAYDETIKGWADALELRDQETEGHSGRVTELTLTLARMMGIAEDQIIHIKRGSLLHDIGKMGVSDSILLKPGPLDDREWEIMHRHPDFAYEMLAPIEYLKPALNIPYCHHEKYNGTGYPRGLKGDEIPLEARIFAVVDVFDALISNRPYRSAWKREDALKYIKKESSTHFDPQVVELFLELIDKTD